MSLNAMSPLFFYKSEHEADTAHTDKKFVIEIGEQHLATTVSDASGKNVQAFCFYAVHKELSPVDIFSLLLSSIPDGIFFTDVILINNRNNYVLLPENIYRENVAQNVLETIHGDLLNNVIHTDHIHQWEIAAVHGMDHELEALIRHQFPQVRTLHFVSPALRHSFRNIDTEIRQSIKLFFYPACFIAQVFSGDQLQLLQHFYFETSQDVVYHLLNLADKFHLDTTEIHVGVSGPIDMNGEVWKELNRCFLKVSTDVIHQGDFDDNHFPSHYFTPFFMVPTCV